MLELLSFFFVSLLGAMSPGPSFAIVARHALSGSRRNAILATLGVLVALFVHILYCSLGVSVLIQKSAILFRMIQIMGAIYLTYLGVQLFFQKKKDTIYETLSSKKAFFSGFFTNLFNPNVTLFILSLYMQFIRPKAGFLNSFLTSLIIPSSAMFWFFGLSFFVTHRAFRPYFSKYQYWLMKATGIGLIALVFYVLLF